MNEATERKRLLKKLRTGLRELGIACGIPIVMSGDNFVLPKNDSTQMRLVRFFVDSMSAENDAAIGAEPTKTAERVRNSFVVRRRGSKPRTFVEIVDAPPRDDGTSRVKYSAHGVHEHEVERLNFHLRTYTMGARIVYESELEALRKLKTLVDVEDYERYVVTGMLTAQGRSGTLYLIRKSRPTLAFTKGERPKILCALCMHPLGYFASSWMGAMPPTDEVIAHLLMIRSDEHYFWRKANQIPYAEPNSGV